MRDAILRNRVEPWLTPSRRSDVPPFMVMDVMAAAARIEAAEQELKDSGRVVIRYSGTEALARVMIEAEDESAMRRHADAIAGAIRQALGA